MKKLILKLCAASAIFAAIVGIAYSQTYPSPTFAALTVNGTSTLSTVVGSGNVGAPSFSINTDPGSTVGNQFLGFNSGANLASGGTFSTGFGYDSLEYLSTGIGNTAFGYQALQGTSGALTTGNQNTGVGNVALGNCQGACANNTAVGYNAGNAITTGSQNTIVGSQAGRAIGAGQYNTVMGYAALDTCALVSGNCLANTTLGYSAGSSITTGNSNTIVGASVGSSTLTTGSSNILIGTSSGVTTVAAGTSSEINIGGALIGFAIAPTLTSGWGSAPTAPAETSTFSFHAVAGGTGETTTGIIGLPTAPTSWNCNAQNLTHTTYLATMSAQTASSATFTWTTAPAASDVIWFKCLAN